MQTQCSFYWQEKGVIMIDDKDIVVSFSNCSRGSPQETSMKTAIARNIPYENMRLSATHTPVSSLGRLEHC